MNKTTISFNEISNFINECKSTQEYVEFCKIIELLERPAMEIVSKEVFIKSFYAQRRMLDYSCGQESNEKDWAKDVSLIWLWSGVLKKALSITIYGLENETELFKDFIKEYYALIAYIEQNNEYTYPPYSTIELYEFILKMAEDNLDLNKIMGLFPNAEVKFIQNNLSSEFYINLNGYWTALGKKGNGDNSLKENELRIIDYKLEEK